MVFVGTRLNARFIQIEFEDDENKIDEIRMRTVAKELLDKPNSKWTMNGGEFREPRVYGHREIEKCVDHRGDRRFG
jgi:hypothetical protein